MFLNHIWSLNIIDGDATHQNRNILLGTFNEDLSSLDGSSTVSGVGFLESDVTRDASDYLW